MSVNINLSDKVVVILRNKVDVKLSFGQFEFI